MGRFVHEQTSRVSSNANNNSYRETEAKELEERSHRERGSEV